MGLLQSPGVQVQEIAVGGNVIGSSSTVGAFAGAFAWGPVMEPTLITSKSVLLETFGAPKVNYGRKDWYSVAFFLKYSNACWVTRVVADNAKNAVGFKDGTANVAGKEVFVPNKKYFDTQFINSTNVDVIAKYPGSIANGLELHILDAMTFGESEYAPIFDSAPEGTELHVLIIKDTDGTKEILEKYDFLNALEGSRRMDGTVAYYIDVLNNDSKYVYIMNDIGASSVILRGGSLGAEFAEYSTIARSLYPGTGNNTRLVFVDENNYDTQTSSIKTLLDNEVGGGVGSGKPSFDGVSIVVFDGPYVRETYTGFVKDPMSIQYYVTKFNSLSMFADILEPIDFSSPAQTDFKLSGATTDVHPGDAVITGYDLMADFETYDYALLFQGAASNLVGNHILGLADRRKYTTAYVSPQFESCKLGGSQALIKVLADRQAMFSTSYGMMDSNWGLVYDEYNKSQTWIPMNSIVAGLQANVEVQREVWFVGMGFNYGKIDGVIRLAWEQPNAIRDELYKAQINPLTTFRNEGVIFFGSKTLQTKPSPTDRMNVRRLLNFIELSISRSLKYFIGELNTTATRLNVENTIKPFLRDIEARQGIYGHYVLCSEQNNSAQIINTNQLMVDIAVAPAANIDFVTLRVSVTPFGVNLTELYK